MPRNIRHNYSTHAAGRAGQSTFRRGEVIPSFRVSFAEALATGEYVTKAIWYCGNYSSIVMSNAVADSTSSSVALNCQYPCGSWLKVIATTSTGAQHAMMLAVNVNQGYWFTGEPTNLGNGPQTLTAIAAIPVGPTLTLTGDAPAGYLGVPYYFKYTVAGGTAPVTCALAGTLPAGLIFSTTTFVISGIPTTGGTTSFSIVAHSADNQQVTLPDSIAIGTATMEQVVASDLPIMYLPLNDTSGTAAVDLSGNGHNGTYVGGVTLSSVALRPGGRSMLTTALGQYASVLDFPACSTVFNNGHPWTFEIIMQRTGKLNDSSSGERIFGKFVNPGTGNTTFALDVGSPVAGVQFVSGYFSDSVSGTGEPATDTAAITNGVTHIYMVVYDGSSSIKLYKDGILVSNRSIATGLYPQNVTASPITVGASNIYPNSYQFQGYMSDAQIYDYALTADRALAHAQAAGLHA